MHPRTIAALPWPIVVALALAVFVPDEAAAQTKPPARVVPLNALEADADLAPVAEPMRRAPTGHAPREAPRRITKPGRDTAAPVESNAPVKPRGIGSFWSVGGPLILILVALVGGAFLWRRHGPGVTPFLPRDAVDPLGRRMIDARQALLLVRVGSRILVLGSSPAGLQTLTEITDPVEVDLLAGLCKRPASSLDGGVSETVRSLFVGRAAPSATASGAHPDRSSPADSGETDPPGDLGNQRFARSLSARVRSEGHRAA